MIRHSILSLLFLPLLVFSQIGPRQWQDHISLNSCNSVTRSGPTVFASYRAGIVYFDQSEWSPKPLNKINGLHDVGVRLLRSNPYNKKVLVIYDNCNIDVIDEHMVVRNYPDFKMKSLSGKKLINEVTFVNELAYLACGFGIVVFDTERMEIKDTYIIGPNATEVDVQQVAVNDSLIFAASTTGLYYSNYKTRNLSNYRNWFLQNSLPKGFYCGIVNVGGLVITANSPSRIDVQDQGHDSVYSLNTANIWEKYPPMKNSAGTIVKLGPTYKNSFSLFDPSSVIVFDATTGAIVTHLNSFNGQTDYGQMRDVFFAKDHTGNVSYWVADNRFGLYQTLGYFPYDKQNKVTRNGTNSTQIGNIEIYKGKLALAPSLIENAGVGNYSREGINEYIDDEWSYLPVTAPNGVTLLDVTSVMYDRLDNSKTWVAIWSYGIVRYKNNQLDALYNPRNTTMPRYADTIPRCGGLSQDKSGNVWFAHSDNKGLIGVITANGQYQNLQFENGRFTRKTMVDKNGYVWLLHERDGGITIYKPDPKNGIYQLPVLNSNYRLLSSEPGAGNLASKSVYAAAEDHDGRVWIGTSAGISVMYNSSSIFTKGDYDTQPIKIVQDGNVELLLGKETVTSIVIDGANNKWCGTLLGGVYCFSPDGQQQLYHFTAENSPLYSNSIIDIDYDESTGEVFIGTEAGMQSFKSTVLAGEEIYSDVHAYPNPVKPGYQGTVLVRGLMDNSIVKIVDESGNLVWETKSAGGQIEWNIKTLTGTRVATGVYVVYAATTNGEFKALTKVLVVN